MGSYGGRRRTQKNKRIYDEVFGKKWQ